MTKSRLTGVLIFVMLLGMGCPRSESPSASSPEPEPEPEPQRKTLNYESMGLDRLDDEPDPETLPGIEATNEGIALLSPGNRLGFDLYQRLRTREGNLVFSPVGIRFGLAMTLAGARGETAAEIASLLQAEGPSESLHRAYGAALRAWLNPEPVPIPENMGYSRRLIEERRREGTKPPTLQVMSRVFVDESMPLEESFSSLTRDIYMAPARSMDFRDKPERSRHEINWWVQRRTSGRIADLLDSNAIDSDTRLVIANAVHFRGTWREAFSTREVFPTQFWVDGTTPVTVDMMNNKADFGWAHIRDEGLLVLDMPYIGADMSMLWLLPVERDGLPALEARLSAEALERWRAATRVIEVEVQVPRFKIELDIGSLVDHLKALGMSRAFGAEADLSGIAQPAEGLFITGVFHKAYIEVDEKGTEAAGAGATTTGVLSLQRRQPPRFLARHPFIFAVMDNRTGTVLFLGRVTDPR